MASDSANDKFHMFKALESMDTDFREPQQCKLKGNVPHWLTGSLIRNGPGQFEVGKDKMNHLFDGLAVVHRYNIQDGQVTYQNRFIESDNWKRCRKSNRLVASGFGTVGYPDPCKSIFTRHFSYYFLEHEMTDNTNVNVLQMGDELYAMTETNRMMKIDPENLDSLGHVDYNKLISVHLATAHPLQDPDGTTYNLGSCYGKQCKYHIVKTPPPQKGETDHAEKMSILATLDSFHPRSPSYSHSFSITENYVVLIEQPLHINIMKLLASKFLNVSFKDALTFSPNEKARFRVIDKKTGAVHPITYTADSFFTFHTINAYEDGGCIVLDIAAYNDAEIIDELAIKTIKAGMKQIKVNTRRFVFPLNPDKTVKADENLVHLAECTATAVLEDKDTVYCEPQVFDCGSELPRINYDFNARKYRYFYGLDFMPNEQQSDMVQLVKFDLDVQTKNLWENEDPELEPGEPVFIKSPQAQEEDDGVILCPVVSSNPQKPSFLLILDAATFKEVGRAEIPEGVKVPYSFHGLFYTPQEK